MNILEYTIKMKKETQAHYERLSEAVADDEMKRLFSLFAAAEGEHVEKLIAMKKNIPTSGTQNLEGLKDALCAFSPQRGLDQVAKSMKGDPDVCRFAEQEEKETIEFLDQLNRQAENEQLKHICRLLADKERDHLKMLEEIYLFVEEPKTYLEWGEFSNLKSL
ncbi:MAG: ferritin family protein [Desulfuromonadaceae bacterium]|nr:ferritin family protein [Desulfuromonadaceae bacterium]